MALTGKKKKIEAGHYEYRGFIVKKNGSKWDYICDDDVVETVKTLTVACECVDSILDAGFVLVPKKDTPKPKAKAKKTTKKKVADKFEVDIRFIKLGTLIEMKLGIGKPTSIIPSEQNYSLRWDNFSGNIDGVLNTLKEIMYDSITCQITLFHTKELLMLNIGNNHGDGFSVTYNSNSEKNIIRESKPIIHTETSKKCEEICKEATEFFKLGKPTRIHNFEYSYNYSWYNYKNDKKTDLELLDKFNNQIDQKYKARIYIGLSVCVITVCKKTIK